MSAPWMKILSKVGNRAGDAVGMGMGIGQLLQGKQAKIRANEMTPENVDPMQGAFLAELQQKKNALNTGAEYTSSLDAIKQKMAQTQDVLAGNSGGDAGGTISALLKSQEVANQGEGDLLAQGQKSEMAYTGMYGDLLNKIAQRKLELGLLKRAQNEAEWAQKSQNGLSNLAAGAVKQMSMQGGDQPAGKQAIGNGIGGTTQSQGGSQVGGILSQFGQKGIGGTSGAATSLLQGQGGTDGGSNIGGIIGGSGGSTIGSSAGGSGGFLSGIMSMIGK